MDRRGFLKSAASALLLPVAPAIVRAEWLMPIYTRPVPRMREILEYDVMWDSMVMRVDANYQLGGKITNLHVQGRFAGHSVGTREMRRILREEIIKTIPFGASPRNPPEMPRGVQSVDDYLLRYEADMRTKVTRDGRCV